MIVNRYVSRSLITPITLVVATFTFLVWLIQAIRFINLIITKGVDIMFILGVTVLLMPSFIKIVLPIAVCIGVIFYYNKLMCDHEIIILKSAGMSNLEIAKPAIYVCSIAASIGLLFSCYLAPVFNNIFHNKESFFQNSYASMILQEGVFSEPIKGLMIYIDQIKDNTHFKGIVVSDKRHVDKDITIMAKEARVINDENQMIFELTSGNRQEKRKDKISILSFEKFPINISSFIKIAKNNKINNSDLNIIELINHYNTQSSKDGKVFAEIHNRIIWPTSSIMLSIMALSILLKSKISRHGYFIEVFKVSAYSVIILASIILLLSMSARNANYIYLLYSSFIFVTILSLIKLSRS